MGFRVQPLKKNSGALSAGLQKNLKLKRGNNGLHRSEGVCRVHRVSSGCIGGFFGGFIGVLKGACRGFIGGTTGALRSNVSLDDA